MKATIKFCFALIFCFCLSSNVISQEYLVAGDAVRIQIWDSPGESDGNNPISQVNGSYVIGTDGNILLPFVGPVNVAGKSTTEVELIVKDKYADFLKEPFIYIRPLIRLTISGGIAQPGSYRVDPKSSLWELFDLAGGPVSGSNLEKITVVRGGEQVIENLLSAFEKAFSLKDVGIQSGDQISIPMRGGFSIQKLVAWINLGITFLWVYLNLSDRKA
jgi:polysaccharide biosynthesis/export protein